MTFEFVRLNDGPDSLTSLKDDWKRQAEDLGEAFYEDAYPEDIFQELIGRANTRAGVFALKEGDSYLAVCQLNSAYLPGYTEPVMRMRHLTVSPTLDLSEDSALRYGRVLVEVFSEVVNLCTAKGDMASKHMKFHLPSPADRTFFAAVGHALHGADVFTSVESRGAWLYISFK